jgi:hypothetical protein
MQTPAAAALQHRHVHMGLLQWIQGKGMASVSSSGTHRLLLHVLSAAVVRRIGAEARAYTQAVPRLSASACTT